MTLWDILDQRWRARRKANQEVLDAFERGMRFYLNDIDQTEESMAEYRRQNAELDGILAGISQ
jgi:predicted secreted Zn-dependent protease